MENQGGRSGQPTRRQVIGAAAGLAATAMAAGATGQDRPPAPPIRSRLFWTWDHSTDWALNRPGAQNLGASNAYGRSPEAFVQDYTNLLTWAGRHGIDGVVVWGLLRDTHGGVETVKRLCDVATKAGVRLMAGVGLNAYGGVYYEGTSPYCLTTHLTTHPELYAIDPAGKRMAFNFGISGPMVSHHACPSRKENQAFAVESLKWLFKTLPLGGVQIESGDTGVCRCAECEKRRKHPVSGFSWEDMALMYPMAADAIRSVSPDAWIICETYSSPQPYAGTAPAPNFGEGKPAWADACIARFPEDVFVQWVCDAYVAPRKEVAWTEAGHVPAGKRRNIMRSHFGTYWGRFRGEPAMDWIADMAQRSMAAGCDSLSLFGEVSPFHTGAELNYLALADYGSARNPRAGLESYLADVAGPLLGGADAAREYLAFARLLDDRAKIPAALESIRKRLSGLQGEPARRWIWLANHLASFIYPEPPTG